MSVKGRPERLSDQMSASAQHERSPMSNTRAEAVVSAPARAASGGKLQAVRGMNDVLPDEAMVWERLEATVREVFRQNGYRNMRVPLVEPTPLFVRSIGEMTDVVEKEMYTFEDRLNGESLTLRPRRPRASCARPSSTT